MYNPYTKVEIPEVEKAFGTGWLLPLPGLQEYTEKHPDIQATEKKLGISWSKESSSFFDFQDGSAEVVLKDRKPGQSRVLHSPCCCQHSGIL